MPPKARKLIMTDIRVVNPQDPEISAIIASHLSGMVENSPKDSVYAMDASGLSDPAVTLFGAFQNGQCQSIGALKKLSDTEGEIKSMRTIETAMGQGFGKAVLRHIIHFARKNGIDTLLLETGTGQSFEAAHHIYDTHGFKPCSAFGDYEDSKFNRFFAFTL